MTLDFTVKLLLTNRILCPYKDMYNNQGAKDSYKHLNSEFNVINVDRFLHGVVRE
jgi:hypothetical protein